MRTLHGKTVFLTGAASGIGRELALQLAGVGCKLLLVDRDQTGLDNVAAEATAQDVQIHTYCCDLTRRNEIERTVVPPVDVLR